MKKTREEIQSEALMALQANNFTGTLAVGVGTGKSKIACDAIKLGGFKNVLIVSPRTNLQESWYNEIRKWLYPNAPLNSCQRFNFDGTWYMLFNIQTAYKWDIQDIKNFDLLIVDEAHTISNEYFNLIKNFRTLCIPVIGLTGTPNKNDEFKRDVLYKSIPIIYEYYNSEHDGITNKINYFVYEYELDDKYKIEAGTKHKRWMVGEKTQYEYLTKQYELAKLEMFKAGATNYFVQSLLWMKDSDKEKAQIGRKFFYAIKNRKEFLWNLESSKIIALKLKQNILSNPNNKVLLFSELTAQASKLSQNIIHSKSGRNIKETNLLNKQTLRDFNEGKIRDISSCASLTLGLNLSKTNWAIFESYSGSDTNAKQKNGRLKRLKNDEIANVIIIIPKDTQAKVWFESAFENIEYKPINL